MDLRRSAGHRLFSTHNEPDSVTLSGVLCSYALATVIDNGARLRKGGGGLAGSTPSTPWTTWVARATFRTPQTPWTPWVARATLRRIPKQRKNVDEEDKKTYAALMEGGRRIDAPF